MRTYITFSICDESGEADLTPKSRLILDELMEEQSVFAVDVIGDMLGIIEQAHNIAYTGMRRGFAEIAIAAHGEEKARELGYVVD